MYIGKSEEINDVAYEYRNMAESDERIGNLLFQNAEYKQAMYFYIQAMEKYIKEKIFSIVNPELEYYIEKNRHHELENSIEFLIEVLSTDFNTKEQIKNQLEKFVLRGIRFNVISNSIRYPRYSKKKSKYVKFIYDKKDCIEIKSTLENLKKFLKELQRV